MSVEPRHSWLPASRRRLGLRRDGLATAGVTTRRIGPTDGDTRMSRRRPGRPKGGRVLVDRAEMLAAATRLITTRGPDVTLDDIAAEADVTKPILYRTIGDKDALVSALSESLVDRINRAVDNAAGLGSEPRAGFESAVRGYLTAVDANRNLYLFVNAGGQGSDRLRRLIDRSSQQMIELFSAHPNVTSPDARAHTWAYAIVGAFQTVTMMWLRDEYCDLDDIADHLTQLLWPGISTVGGSIESDVGNDV